MKRDEWKTSCHIESGASREKSLPSSSSASPAAAAAARTSLLSLFGQGEKKYVFINSDVKFLSHTFHGRIQNINCFESDK